MNKEITEKACWMDVNYYCPDVLDKIVPEEVREMSLEELITTVKYIASQTRYMLGRPIPTKPPVTYDESLVRIYLPELIRRLEGLG